MHIQKIFIYAFVFSCALFKVSIQKEIKTSPPVKISLQTPWESTPLILEAIEFLSKDNSEVYFNLISNVFKNELPSTTYDQYQYILNLPEVSELKKENLLKLSLSLHSEAPLIQSHYHYYNASVVPSHQSSNGNFNKNCENWMDWYGTQICDIEKLMNVAKITLTDGKYSMTESNKETPLFLPIDHVKKAPSKENGVVIFYCDVLSSKFSQMLSKLMKMNKEAGLTVVIRYKKSKNNNEKITISGYGVEMAIKNTEYKVIDDRKLKSEGNDESIQNSKKIIPNIPIKEFDLEALKIKYPKKSDELDKYYDFLLEQTTPILKKMQKNETEDIGTKIIQYIKSSSSPLNVLEQLTNNFPRVSHIINQMPLLEDYEMEVKKIQKMLYTSEQNKIFVNGIDIDVEDLNPYNVLKLMVLDTNVLSKLKSLGFTNEESVNLLDYEESSSSEKKSSSEYYDVRDEMVSWWNDLETDKRYKRWSRNIMEVLQPLYYRGQLHSIARNLYSAVFCMDISKYENMEILKHIFIFIERFIPIRFGILPSVDLESKSSINSLTAVSFEVIIKNFSKKAAQTFIEKISKIAEKNELSEDDLSDIVDSVVKNLEAKDIPEDVSLNNYEEIIEFGMENYYNKLKSFNEKFDISPSKPALFVNGLYSELNNEWQQSLITTAASELENIQEKVYFREYKNNDKIYDKILSSPNVRKRKNIYIYPSEENPEKFLDIQSFESVDQLKYLSNSGKLGSHISLWTISDLSTKKGVQLALDSLKLLDSKDGKNTRLSIIHSPNDDSKVTNVLSNIINQVSMVNIPKDIKNEEINPIKYLIQLLEARMKMDDDVSEKAILKEANEINEKFENLMIQKDVDYINQKPAIDFKPIIELALKNEKNLQAIIINGRLIGPWKEDVIFNEEDIKLAIEYEFEHHIRAFIGMVRAYGKKKEWDAPISQWYSNTIMKVSSIVSSEETVDEISTGYDGNSKPRLGSGYFKKFKSQLTFFTVGNIETAKFHFSAIINPLSENGQKLASFLSAIQKMPEVYIEVQLNVPRKTEDDVELNRFFRYVFKTEMEFDENNELVLPIAEFQNIPIDPLFTVGIHAPQAWLVTPIVSVHDLDNICLKSEKDGVNAIFELKNILLEGHARDIRLNTPPRGVQLILGTKSYPAIVDTIVMANLGYFQLKANPGVWELKLRSGRSSELYDIINVGKNYRSWFNEPNETLKKLYETNGVTVALTSFEGANIFLRADKKYGMESEDVLTEKNENSQDDGNIWGKLKKKLRIEKVKEEQTEKINIFSVASGHLYERLLSVMTLGVMKHTNTPVKFWLIENFLSPSFKNFIPHLAKEYGFEYELITYKWPHWLRSQSEKQRTIWGYKILFLDVLFPLSLEKVIFVDADQIVRADLKELVDMDLHGAPYGYTPFCNSRKETEGFRFWKTGYWEKHLHGKPYHISALYVIDLVKFRKMAAGDRLRGEYQILSADKNSLANLDQDLPNNMQDKIPIYSLPQEWLWCETWCDDESLKTAKTIDLCNNPLTKEPKLDRARRLLPEWSVYDNEIADFEKKVEQLLNIENKNETKDKKPTGKDEL